MRVKKAIGVAAVLAIAGLSTMATATTASAGVAEEHGLGLDISALHAPRFDRAATSAESAALPVLARAGAAPVSFDLSQYALPAGNQGKVGSCVTWATGYSGYGILMKEQGIAGAPMAPMFIYSQISKGNDQGTLASVALPMEQKQGIDTKSDYTQGDFDYTTQPTQAERTNAAHYKLSGFKKLPTTGSAAKAAIKDAISQGMPVAIGTQVHQSFRSINSSNALNYTYLPGGSSDPVIGGHEITIVGYNDKGVKIENSWGGSWGANGFFTVPWSFFNSSDMMEIHAMGKLVQS